MLAASPRNTGSICTRCAFRLRLLALQQQRRPKSQLVKTHADDKRSSVVRFYKGSDYKDGSRSNSRDPLKELSGGLIRRHLRGDDPDSKQPSFLRQRAAREAFRDVLLKRLDIIKEHVKDAPVLEQLAKDRREIDGRKEESFSKLWKNFTQKILLGEHGGKVPFMGNDASDAQLWDDMLAVWRERGVNGLDDRIKYNFYGHVTNTRFTESDIKNQVALADLRYPSEWFPATRTLQRTIHLHVGPTNSGKTYQALQRLEAAARGVYAGPLRLLAHEVYTRMNAKGKSCILVTGEERRRPEGDAEYYDLTACTVEMMPLNTVLDVAVIDEIQMIGNADRGWAWTQAVLGVQAKEVHLCGEARTVPLIKELCASVGEKLEVHEYERLSPLQVAHSSLDGNLRKLRKGDCIVSFSVMGIHALRREIEKATGRKVAIVYGSLPPETRAQQARLFNDPNNDYDYLVASDAVGMGLNLAIKRVIFESSSKFDGTARRTLSIADIKQIGGRAGRFRTSLQATEAPVSQQELAAAKGEPDPEVERDEDDTPENVGLVTTLERFDFPIVAAAMDADPEPIRTAGIFPPAQVLQRFATYFPPGTPFSYMLTRLHELSQMHRRFHLCGLKDQIWLADIIEPIQGLTVSDRNTICSAPASKGDAELWNQLLPAYGRCIVQQSGGGMLDIEELPLETLEAETTNTREFLRDLERLHKGVITYLWLSYRFPGIFNTRALAFHVKGLVEQKIENVLGQISFSETQRKKLAKAREKELMRQLLLEQQQETEASEATEAAESASVGPSADLGESSEEPAQNADAEEAESEDTLAKLADEELSTQPESEEQYQESEIGEELAGTASSVESTEAAEQQSQEVDLKREAAASVLPTDATAPADGGSFSGEPYLQLEEESEVEESREVEGNENEKKDSAESIDSEKIIEEITRHEGDIPRKPNEAASGAGNL